MNRKSRALVLTSFLPTAAACAPAVPRSPPPVPSIQVSFNTPAGETIRGDLYGSGDRGVVMIAHGGYATRQRWQPQARTLAAVGFRVLVFASRAAAQLTATGREPPCLYDEACQAADVLAAVRYLHQQGATEISAIGGSIGAAAVAQASVEAAPGEIDRIVLLAPARIAAPEKMKGRKLVITTRDDANAAGPRLPAIRELYDKAHEPKRFILLDGSAHAHRIFATEHSDRVMREIVRFLRER